MNVSERMRLCNIISKMERQTDEAKRLGLCNQSVFLGKCVGEYKKELVNTDKKRIVK